MMRNFKNCRKLMKTSRRKRKFFQKNNEKSHSAVSMDYPLKVSGHVDKWSAHSYMLAWIWSSKRWENSQWFFSWGRKLYKFFYSRFADISFKLSIDLAFEWVKNENCVTNWRKQNGDKNRAWKSHLIENFKEENENWIDEHSDINFDENSIALKKDKKFFSAFEKFEFTELTPIKSKMWKIIIKHPTMTLKS